MANSIRARRLLKPSATRPDIRLQPIYVLPNHEISLAKPGGVHIRYSSSQALRFIFEPAVVLECNKTSYFFYKHFFGFSVFLHSLADRLRRYHTRRGFHCNRRPYLASGFLFIFAL